MELSFGGLSNSVDRYKVPTGFAYDGSNFGVNRGVLEGGPRHGDVWARSGAHVNDVQGGFTYAEYGSTQEFIVVLKKNGDTTATAYKVNPSTGAYTDITGGTGLTWGSTDAENVWTFAQYEDNLRGIDLSLTAEDEAFVDSLVPPGEHSGKGFQDPAYPVTGRGR